MDAGRYLLTRTVDGRTSARGWWSVRATAERKFRSWVGTYGQPGTRIALTDEADGGRVIHRWPDEP